ncbi:class I SAM-dependent methyltransferase [Microbacterium sp. A93]|uniref:class I SAM-dependent methyltransferase n=1 Tax=Microbacterium sp. A93 TaxID=3450716 RepID=UPI003F43B279
MPVTPDFDALYRADPDPFAVGSRWYERRKIAVVLASLSRPEYDAGWDAAAGTGHLAVGLAPRCCRVLATDTSAVAVDSLAGQPLPANLTVRRSALPELPAEARTADLVVVSEVLYYLPDPQREATLSMLAGLKAEIVAVHWRHHPEDTYLSGAETTRELDSVLSGSGFLRTVAHEDTDFVLSVHRPYSEDSPDSLASPEVP